MSRGVIEMEITLPACPSRHRHRFRYWPPGSGLRSMSSPNRPAVSRRKRQRAWHAGRKVGRPFNTNVPTGLARPDQSAL